MNSTERIRQILKARKIPFSRIEKDLGFSNAYLAQLQKDMPSDRLFAVAKYLGVSPEYLATGEESSTYYQDPETAVLAQKLLADPSLRALMDAAEDSRPEDVQTVTDLLKRMKGTNPDG